MHVLRLAALVSMAVALAASEAAPALGFGAGGTAPGGPLSGGIRPACNGYDMDGTVTRGMCDGRSVDERRAGARRDDRSR